MRPEVLAAAGFQPAPVIVMSSGGGTLPSNDLPMLEPVTSGAPRLRRGVDPRILVALVVFALLAGFSLGFVVGRGFG